MAIMQTAENLERIAREFAERAVAKARAGADNSDAKRGPGRRKIKLTCGKNRVSWSLVAFFFHACTFFQIFWGTW